MKLTSNLMQQAEFARNVFHVKAPVGITIEDITNPEFFSHVAARLHSGDRIELVAEDLSFFMEVIVLDARANYARVSILRQVAIAAPVAAGPASDTYTIKWGSAEAKFRVIRKSDKVVMKEGFASKADAEGYAAELAKVVQV